MGARFISRTAARTAAWTAASLISASLLSAQEGRVEASALLGWTFSDGVTGAAVTVPGIGSFNGIEPSDSFSWAITAGFLLNDRVGVEFQYDRQQSVLTVRGTREIEVGDMGVENYHGVVLYHLGEPDSAVRPFLLGGMGATRYGRVDFVAGGQPRETGGETRFSTTWGAGVKMYFGKTFGLRLQGRWTPTFIKSDAAGWWCDPYWGCYVLSDAQYANQIELAGGLTVRF